ncbi:MarR family winged helix-turn-helix transcriptional regulator [Staphylococcus equorum]|uniref:MarR family winged helix-turn-helix transcriptional regulator n=1 Tax=Staphylococcus equorum TaxID=246432 RepID=UPI000D1C9D87|nr:winged helix DNA-binding protein [Staphylococcus equorum]MDG0824019.1 winged helix DNA-binding protein [Staphylococcus equorum]MDK9869547.1 winged helix DNA-binding protein [Staphylococcus equorum]MDN5636814.1 winged helix DNA-binding protein [Staphylococcus equorum]MEB7846947.1 winged helix DNA-binding protein [Staphylococcus equorum]MEB8108299.1 winged helix DNA-binding protein [Staphylococcus equorum]
MEQQQKINNWIEMTKYVHYTESLIEKTLKQQYHLSLKEFYVLYEIFTATGKKYKMNDLIKIVDLSQSAMSRLIVRIERMDCPLVFRQECVEDQRAMYIYLTEEGLTMTKKALNTYEQLIEKIDLSYIRKLTHINDD